MKDLIEKSAIKKEGKKLKKGHRQVNGEVGVIQP
jgi:hypothetical protein